MGNQSVVTSWPKLSRVSVSSHAGRPTRVSSFSIHDSPEASSSSSAISEATFTHQILMGIVPPNGRLRCVTNHNRDARRVEEGGRDDGGSGKGACVLRSGQGVGA